MIRPTITCMLSMTRNLTALIGSANVSVNECDEKRTPDSRNEDDVGFQPAWTCRQFRALPHVGVLQPVKISAARTRLEGSDLGFQFCNLGISISHRRSPLSEQ